MSRAAIAAVLALVTLPIVLLSSPATVSAGPAPVFTMYVPFEDQQVSDGLKSIYGAGADTAFSDVVSTIDITAAADDSVIYYDHWEDGYEVDIANPIQSTTLVWGDNNAGNGTTPGGGTDDVDSGTVIFLRNTVTLPRVATDIFFDGRDKVASTRGFAMTRAGWDSSVGTVHAGAVAAADLSNYGTQFDIPVGENIGFEAFDYTGLGVLASDDNTFVEIDTNGDGSVDQTATLEEGETVYIDGGINANATVQTSKPSQVHLITGERNSRYEGRWFEIFPEEIRGDEYIAAAGSTSNTQRVTVFIHNPGDTAITVAVDAEGAANDTNIALAAGAVAAHDLPNQSGARFSSPGNPFSAVSGTVAVTGFTNGYDWGYSLVPTNRLTPGVVVGWGQGNPDLTANHNKIWVAPLDNVKATGIEVFADFDGDGAADLIDTTGDGVGDAASIIADAFESIRIADPDFDATGARIYTTDGTLISVAWGQDPADGECCNAFDLGTAVLPTTSLVTTKDHRLVNDLNGDGNVNPGDTLRYTIRSVDAGALSLTNVNVIDTLPSTLIYVNGSTTLDGNPLADDSVGSTVFPVDESGVDIPLLDAGEAVLVEFDATLVNPFPLFTQNVRNDVSVTADQANSTATSIVPVVIPDLYIAKNGPTAPLLPGEQFDYTIDVSNVSVSPQTGIDVTDPLPGEVDWVSTTVVRPIDDPGVGGSSDHTDNFNTAGYNNNSANWVTNWIEVDPAGAAQAATEGDVRVISDLGSNRVRLRGANRSIRRTFDASTWDKAFVNFDWRRSSFEASDLTSFQVSTTGGSSWIELDAFNGPADDAGFANVSYDLTRYVGQNISLRFVTNSAMATDDTFYFDNFELQLDKRILETVAGGAPPALYTGGELVTGESLTVTVTVTVADPIDPAIDAFTNTATAFSNENASPVQSQAASNVARASIGDTVWHDIDGDGIIDTGEPGLSGVEVSLYDGTSALVGTRVTDANGNYRFVDLDPDTYTVTITADVPAGMAATSDPDGGQDQTTIVPVTFGENNDSTDFAYAFPASFGDRVYSDLDGDGVENNADFGLDGITVSITGTTAGTSPDDSTTTSNGSYQFSDLLPGTYEVTVDTSPLTSTSYSTTGGDTRTHVVVSQTDVTDADFGYVIPASVGDLVWHDLNANGVFDSGEPPFANVEVTITGTGIIGSETRTTDANGYYLFSNLDAGTFTVSITPASGALPADYDSSTAGGYSQTLTVGGDEQNADVDFGFYTQTSIGDLVFDDRNGDGTRGLSEPGLVGVNVTITGTSAGASHPGGLTVATDGSGNYDFTDLEPGTYTVTVDETGFAAGTFSSFDGADPDVTVISGQDENGVDFGYVFPATVGDFVFHDLNGNGTFDVGEPGIDGVELRLDGGSLTTPRLDTTINGGQYLFSNLEPGDYQVTLDLSTLPAGYALTTSSNTGASNVFDVTIVSGSSIDSVDFGADTTADVGDLVYHDRNASGDYDFGDQVLAGVLVTLTDDVGAFVADDTTDAGGEYLFTDLDPGTYTVTIETGGGAGSVPAGYLVTTTGGDARTITLVSSADRLDLDFGYATTGSIGDYVFDDVDANGIDDDGLASVVGIENVAVTVTGTTTGASHSGGLTISTDADGGYLFDDLQPGDYTVEFDVTGVLDGAVVTLGSVTRSVTVRSAEDIDTVDLGAYFPAAVGDRVFDDLNGDGAYQSGNDGGFGGVTVTLTGGPLGAATITTQTDPAGVYSFTGLEPGDYTVTLTTSDLPAGSVNTLGGTSQNLTLVSGEVDDAIDFGFYVGARIGDKVFDDGNGNGIDDDGATGLSAVTIRLYSGPTASAANLVDTQDTNSSGNYSFNDLEPGTYTVEIDTNDLDPNATITTSSGSTTFTVTVASGDDNRSLDFGVANPIAIGDFVYEDVNGNGVQDSGEPGLDNVDVTITGTSAGASHSGGLTVQTVNGLYQFDNLLPGDYDVAVDVVDVPAGYTSNTATTISATYSGGDDIDAVDFGFVRLVSIGNFVFDDSDGDGDPTGESGLAGVTLELTGPGVPANTTLTTDATGAYSFDDLAPGNYTVTVTSTPAGYTNTLGGTSQAVTIQSNVGDDTVDFGYYLGAAIGNEIFDDVNGDGDRDAGEPGFDNVTVTLYSGSTATAGNEVSTANTGTDGSGSYDFVGLAPGTYTVAVTDGLPSGVVNTLGATSQTFTVTSGDDENNADFGYYTPGTIGNYVWEDRDGNGLDDDGVAADRGFFDVTVTLTGTTPSGAITPRNTNTDTNGAYSFDNLAPGTYQVALDTADLPSGALSTTGSTPSDFTISSIAIASGTDDDTNDFGVARPATIGDLIFRDDDGTGTFTTGDANLNGVTVTLTGGNLAAAGTTDTTGTDGLYSFAGLYPGDYTVTVSATGGDLSGDEFATTSGGYVQTVTVASGAIDNSIDFGFAEPAAIGDRLFLDLNGDGVQSGAGEVGIPDVDITITGTSSGAAHTGGFTISTGPGGAYSFTELVAGDYTITVETSDVDLDANFAATTPGGDSQTVTLGIGENITTVDFGYAEPVTIGDVVFTDDNGDGAQTGDTGLGNVTLELRDGTTVIATATSDATTGAYSFDNVLPGSYTVVVTGGLPAGAFPTTTGGNTQSVTVTSGTDDLSLDFGFAQPATIGNQVYVDNNANSTFDSGDTGVAATVTITGPSHPGGQAFSVAADGTYAISGLAPGSYDLVVSGLPANATQTEGAGGQTVIVGSNDTDNTADFGFHTPSSIGDLVFEDLDGDGVRDVGEVGYAGVTLQLTGPGVAADTTITTDATGAYSFGGLQPGDYDVTVLSTPTGAVNSLGGTTQSITLTSGQDLDTADFGYYEPSTLGDFVFDDLNGNGTQDDGAASVIGITDVDVTLTGTTGAGATITPITVTTDTNGAYDFGSLAPGTYAVAIDTTDLVAGSTSTTGGFSITSLTVTSGSDTNSVDFGVAAPADLGDFVFDDVNGNGNFDAGTDSGYESVTVTVTGTSAGASFPGGTTVTTGTVAGGDAGEYGLGALLPGTYEVTVTPGTGTLPANGISSTGGDTQTITLTSGQSDLGVDFGYAVPAFIGDQLFVDNNANGVFDTGDTGIAGVDVTLTGPGQPVGGTTIVSDADGLYGFSNLTPGDYTVTVDTTDPQYVATFPGGGEISSTGGATGTATIASTSNIDTVDFGWYQLGSIGDFVFDDTNGDGGQDAGEPGLEGVTVTLDGGDLAAPITTTTGAGATAGEYAFTGLTPGTYTVTVTVAGSTATTPGGTTQTIVVGSGVGIDSADFGFAAPAAIGDTVFHDLNDNGIQEPGEPGLAGITVTITGPGLPAAGLTDDTDSNGIYGFSGLEPGDYVVMVDTAGLPSAAYTTSSGGDTTNVTLESGVDRLDVDFGYSAPASIGDLVFDDLNGNGTFDIGEPGLANVVIRITGGDLPTGGTTDTTDAGGAFDFGTLTPGTYFVEILSGLPSGAVTTLGDGGISITVDSGETNNDVDFGAYRPTSIGDLVFEDEDGNGSFNGAAGDAVLAGVEVTLTGGSLPTAGITDTTDANGLYSFDGLAPGDYTVTLTAGVPAGSQSTTGGDTTNVTLVSGTPRSDIDYGFATPITIGDLVFDDLDADGSFDAGEPGLDGVVIELVDGNGDVVATDTTDANGAYEFTAVAPSPLDYTVRLVVATLPTGYTSTTPASLAVTVTSGDDVGTADFGLTTTGSIGDYVYDDLNGNGLQDDGAPADRGISGLTVTLTGGNLAAAGITDVTDANGAYLFADLDPGDYVVTVSAPTGATASTAGGDSQSVTLLSNDAVTTADFGYAYGSSIGDRIWNDRNANGIDDAEPGLGGIVVRLSGNGVNLSDTTDGNGNYLFTGLAPGEYTITVDNATIPVGANSGTQLTATTVVSTTLTVQSDDVVDTVDYGFATTASIGDTIFDDLDGDGILDVLEPGLDDVLVELLDGATVVATTTTINGAYRFDGIEPGTYTVRVDTSTLPSADSTQTTAAASATVTVGSDDETLTVDLGFARPSTIGDTIWHDLDADGVFDAGEPGLAGVKVDVYVGATLVASDTTDANGEYRVTGLAPGTYTVAVDPTTLPTGATSGATYVASAGVPTSVVRTVESGDTVNDADFAFHTTASIGTTVFHDLDANGLDDDGAATDAWLDSVVVNLVDPSDGSTVATTTTTDGAYSFDGVAPGTYEVQVDETTVPTGYVTTTGNPITIAVVSDALVDDVDFGYAALTGGSIGDEVFEDANGDGVRQPGESGITVTIEVLDGTVVVDRVTTNGGYAFINLPPGDYTVQVDPTSIPTGYVVTTPGGNTQTYSIASGDGPITTADFGFAAPATVGDYLWHDLNGDGLDNDGAASTVGLGGITVELRDAGGSVIDVDVTDANGAYSLTAAPGTYDVVVVDSTVPNGANSGSRMTSTTSSSVPVTLTSNEVRNNVDIGYATTASIGDAIFDDLDGDGIQGPSEPGLIGVTVELFDGTNTITTVTDSNGLYSFAGLTPGDYAVSVDASTLPAGSYPTTSTTAVDVSVQSDEVVDDVDLGFTEPGVISGEIFTDANGDGLQTGEAGVDSIVVELLDAAGNVVDTVTTVGGVYTFAGVVPGEYTIRPVVPAGSTFTLPNAGTDDTVDSDVDPATGESGVITITSGADIADVDAGLYELATIGDTVFVDLDGDGVQDADEPGIAGVVVTVRDASGNIIGTDTTDGAGNYSIDVVPGTHTATVTLPSGYAAGAAGDTQTVTVTSGGSDDTIDFPAAGSNEIAGSISYDMANDGSIDSDDPGLGDVTVTATWDGPDGPVVFTTTTNADGSYVFAGLPPGDFTIAVDSTTLPDGIVDPTVDPDGVLDFETVLTIGGTSVADVDFGVSGTADLGDNVFLDANGNGILDAGESGVGGVSVTATITTNDGLRTYTTVTDANGNYQFNDLPAGVYTITIDTSTVPAGMAATVLTFTTTLSLNGVDFSVDFPIEMIDGPVANDDSASTPFDTPVTVPVTDNDSSEPGVTVTVTNVSNPDNGTVVINDDGTVTYTPDGGFTGTDTVVYEICDLDGLNAAGDTPANRAVYCSTATVTVTVGAPPVPPTDPGTPTTPTDPSTPTGSGTPANTADATGTAQTTSNSIPRTGSDIGGIQKLAAAILLGGLALLLASRRRRPDDEGGGQDMSTIWPAPVLRGQ